MKTAIRLSAELAMIFLVGLILRFVAISLVNDFRGIVRVAPDRPNVIEASELAP